VGPNQFPSALLSLNGKCCYGLDLNGNCLTDPNSCLVSFANRGWSVCCGAGQLYSVSTGTCLPDCSAGYVLLGVFCMTLGQGLDFRGILGQPTEMGLSVTCNGAPMPP
jgi:hypothetical protein